MAVISLDGDIVTGTEVKFLSTDSEQYPQLTRLSVDFDYRILELDEVSQPAFLVVSHQYLTSEAPAITPTKPSLKELEAFTNDNILDILQDALYEPPEVKCDIDEL
ncbi:MAG: hypothetical protein ACRBCS_06415 [Cellvibrionaceae bacterium]